MYISMKGYGDLPKHGTNMIVAKYFHYKFTENILYMKKTPHI